MQKYFTSIFTDKKGYGLSPYNVEIYIHKKMKYEIMGRVRLEECERNIRVMPSEARLIFFLKKYKIRALKFIV